MAVGTRAYIVPTMQMTQEDLEELRAGTLPCQAVWKSSRDKPGACADIVAMPGNPVHNIAATAQVDFVMRADAVHQRPDDESTHLTPHRTLRALGAAHPLGSETPLLLRDSTMCFRRWRRWL